MVVSASKFEKYLSTNGVGAFGKVEYAGDAVVLRTADIKTPDRGTNVRMYFDAQREEVMTGRRFDLMGDLWLCRQGIAYRFFTSLRVDELPEGVEASVELTEDAKDALGLMSYSIDSESGQVIYTVLAFRPIELERWVSTARLIFRQDSFTASRGGGSKGNSTRTRKSTKKTKKPEEAEAAKETGDEGDVPEIPSEGEES